MCILPYCICGYIVITYTHKARITKIFKPPPGGKEKTMSYHLKTPLTKEQAIRIIRIMKAYTHSVIELTCRDLPASSETARNTIIAGMREWCDDYTECIKKSCTDGSLEIFEDALDFFIEAVKFFTARAEATGDTTGVAAQTSFYAEIGSLIKHEIY